MTGPDRWPGPPDDYAPECPACEGAGTTADGDRCPECDGLGVMVDADDGWAAADEAYDRAVDA